jgi:hypothetical protein
VTAHGHSLVAGICLCSCAVPLSRAYPSFSWPFEKLAQAPVIATCIVQETSRDSLPVGSEHPVVAAHAVVRVLRSFPQSTFASGERIRLDYEALPEGHSGMGGPDVPQLKPGDILVLPLKLNPQPSSTPWRLIGDEGASLVIPAIVRDPLFASSPKDGRGFLLHEIASTLIAGTRRNLFAEAVYVSGQKAIGQDLMSLLKSKLAADDDRWSMIAASFLSSLGVPRPSVAELRAGKDANGGDHFSGSLITAVLQKLGPSERAKENLIHHLLVNSDIASWGVGLTLREFAQEPSLTRELSKMLKARSPGALSVAHSVLIAGQKEILEDATALSFYYLSTPGAKPFEFHFACWVIRDFGTDEQFARLLGEIRSSQYHDQRRYDELWRNIIWSDNDRERAVLEILLKDNRMYQPHERYSDIARGELTRIQARKQ